MSRDYFLTFHGCVGIRDGVLDGDSVAVLKGRTDLFCFELDCILTGR